MIIIGQGFGQLGNRLWLFANLMAFCEEYGIRLANPAFGPYARYFAGTHQDPLCRYPRKELHYQGESIRRGISWAAEVATRVISRFPSSPPFVDAVTLPNEEEALDLRDPVFLSLAKRKRLLFIRGWLFRDRTSLEKHECSIRSFFQPVAPILELVGGTLEKARRDVDILIGIHIRQGDIKQWRAGQYYFATAEYIFPMRRLIEEFKGRRVRFLVCSNEPQVHESFDGLDVIFGPQHIVADMYTLAECDFILGPPSTYSMWASFYGSVPLYVMRDPSLPVRKDSFTIYYDA